LLLGRKEWSIRGRRREEERPDGRESTFYLPSECTRKKKRKHRAKNGTKEKWTREGNFTSTNLGNMTREVLNKDEGIIEGARQEGKCKDSQKRPFLCAEKP